MIFKLINWFITFFDLALQTPQNIETHAYWIFHTRDKLSAGHIPFDFHYIFLIDAVLQGFCWSLNDLSSYGEKKKAFEAWRLWIEEHQGLLFSLKVRKCFKHILPFEVQAWIFQSLVNIHGDDSMGLYMCSKMYVRNRDSGYAAFLYLFCRKLW